MAEYTAKTNSVFKTKMEVLTTFTPVHSAHVNPKFELLLDNDFWLKRNVDTLITAVTDLTGKLTDVTNDVEILKKDIFYINLGGIKYAFETTLLPKNPSANHSYSWDFSYTRATGLSSGQLSHSINRSYKNFLMCEIWYDRIAETHASLGEAGKIIQVTVTLAEDGQPDRVVTKDVFLGRPPLIEPEVSISVVRDGDKNNLYCLLDSIQVYGCSFSHVVWYFKKEAVIGNAATFKDVGVGMHRVEAVFHSVEGPSLNKVFDKQVEAPSTGGGPSGSVPATVERTPNAPVFQTYTDRFTVAPNGDIVSFVAASAAFKRDSGTTGEVERSFVYKSVDASSVESEIKRLDLKSENHKETKDVVSAVYTPFVPAPPPKDIFYADIPVQAGRNNLKFYYQTKTDSYSFGPMAINAPSREIPNADLNVQPTTWQANDSGTTDATHIRASDTPLLQRAVFTGAITPQDSRMSQRIFIRTKITPALLTPWRDRTVIKFLFDEIVRKDTRKSSFSSVVDTKEIHDGRYLFRVFLTENAGVDHSQAVPEATDPALSSTSGSGWKESSLKGLRLRVSDMRTGHPYVWIFVERNGLLPNLGHYEYYEFTNFRAEFAPYPIGDKVEEEVTP